jgi:hypothetical protein
VSIFKDGVYYPLGCAEEMSEGEYEYQYGLCNDPDLDDEPPALKTPRGRWRTREGEELEVGVMSTKHIRNVIKLFTRAGWGDHRKLDELRLELARRGEYE